MQIWYKRQKSFWEIWINILCFAFS
jgi:hypothetical protein